MIVELSSIGATPKAIDEQFGPSEIDLSGENITLKGPVLFAGEAFRAAARAHIRGTLTADIRLDCTRCLESIQTRLEVPFDSVFVDAAEETDEIETEVTDEALDESLVQNGVIDIAEVVREQILLAMPETVLCKDGCKGLCPQCGANLNLIDCKCSDDDIDPRWAALQEIKGSG
jgi:uncharacterized protein